jgi:hypothetical protein
MEKWKFLTLLGLELRPLGHPGRSQSLYRLARFIYDQRQTRCAGGLIKHLGLLFNNVAYSKCEAMRGLFQRVLTQTDRIMWQPPWSNGQSSWLQIRRSRFDSQRYQIIWEVMGLERDPLSLVSTTEELLERKSSGSGLENRKYGRKDPLCRPRGTLYP